MQLATVKC